MPGYAPRMADVSERAGLGRPAVIAIGFAIVALLTSVAAVVVVLGRRAAPTATHATRAVSAVVVIDRDVDASEVTKLKRDIVENVRDAKGTIVGVRVKDERLRTAYGLEPRDVITAINGRALRREFDVYDAVLGISAMGSSLVYVEITRDDAPALVRWKVAGDLRTARDTTRPARGNDPFSMPRATP